jgi:hypothetical membrane protein
VKNRRLISVLSLTGILGSVLNILIIITLDLTVPDYNSTTQYVSEFGITPGITSEIVSSWWIVSGIILILFSLALNNTMEKAGRFSFLGPLCICLYGLLDSIGSSIFPMDVAGETITGMIHTIVSFIGITAVTFSPLALVGRMKKDPRWNRLVGFTWITQIIFCVIYVVCVLAFTEIYFGQYVGFLQRVFIYGVDIWIIVLGLSARKALAATGIDGGNAVPA